MVTAECMESTSLLRTSYPHLMEDRNSTVFVGGGAAEKGEPAGH